MKIIPILSLFFRTTALLFLLFILFISGDARDFYFLPINEITLRLKLIHSKIPEASSLLFLFFLFKWILTIFFWMIYFLTGSLMLLLLRFQSVQIKLFASIYSAGILFSFLLILPGKYFLGYDLAYLLARNIMGIFQSPLVLMIVIPIFKLYQTSEKTSKNSLFF